MSYGEVLKSAWNTIWKYKVLWIFGIFAALGTGGGGGGSGSGSRYNFNSNGSGRPNMPYFDNLGNQIQQWAQQNWWIILLVIVFVFALILVSIVLSTYGRIALARGTWQVDEGKNKLTFGELFADSSPYFWRILLLSLLIFLFSIALVIILIVPVVLTMGIGLICLLPFLCLLVPVSWVASIIIEQAIVATIGENLGIIDGLKRGWQVFRSHIGETIVMGLILGIGGTILRFLISLPALIIVLPFIGSLMMRTETAIRTGVTISVVLLCLYMPIAWFLGGVLQAYISSAWALTYRRLTGRTKSIEVIG